MAFRVTIHDPVYAKLDRLFDNFHASKAVAAIFGELRSLSPEDLSERNPEAPDEARYPLVMEAFGLWYVLHLAICDRWQEGSLHVVGVEHEIGKRINLSLGSAEGEAT
jgi:hypothetical protein